MIYPLRGALLKETPKGSFTVSVMMEFAAFYKGRTQLMEHMIYKVFHGVFIRWGVFYVRQLADICRTRDKEEFRF